MAITNLPQFDGLDDLDESKSPQNKSKQNIEDILNFLNNKEGASSDESQAIDSDELNEIIKEFSASIQQMIDIINNPSSNKEDFINDFLNTLGTNTRRVIGYPASDSDNDDECDEECDEGDNKGNTKTEKVKYTSIPSSKRYIDKYLSRIATSIKYETLCSELNLHEDEELSKLGDEYYDASALNDIPFDDDTQLNLMDFAKAISPVTEYDPENQYKYFVFTVYPKQDSNIICFDIVVYKNENDEYRLFIPKNYNLYDATDNKPYELTDFITSSALASESKGDVITTIFNLAEANNYKLINECKKIFVDKSKSTWFPLKILGEIQIDPVIKTDYDFDSFVYVGKIKLNLDDTYVTDFLHDYELTPDKDGRIDFYVKNNVTERDGLFIKRIKECVSAIDFTSDIVNRLSVKACDNFVYIDLAK